MTNNDLTLQIAEMAEEVTGQPTSQRNLRYWAALPHDVQQAILDKWRKLRDDKRKQEHA